MVKLCRELFKSDDHTFEAARLHSEALDQVLGFRVFEIEEKLLSLAKEKMPEGSHKTWGQALHGGNQTWVGLSHQTLQTPYNELREMCELLNPPPKSCMIDLGAGYGRLGLVLGGMYPGVKFIGYEYVPERVQEGQRILTLAGCENAQLLEADLTSEFFQLPIAQFYFLYDYGTLPHIRKTLVQLEKIAETSKFKVIARGKGVRSLIQYEFPWLADVYPVIHQEHFSIFSMSQEL
jgi:hypothetical protein